MPDFVEFLSQQNRLEGIRANFVTNQNGEFVGATGSSRDLSNPADLELLKRLRALADVVITDAATARKERYRPSKLAPISVWSKSGDFTGLVSADGFSLHQIDDPIAELEVISKETPAVLLETGPTLTARLGSAKVIDELKLTVTNAATESEARRAAELVLTTLRLDYLKTISVSIAGGNHFFTFGR